MTRMTTNDMQAAVVSSAGCTSVSVMALRQLPLQGRLAEHEATPY